MSDFWSRRRAAVAAESRNAVTRAAEQATQADLPELPDLDEGEWLAHLGLPAPESLRPGDDFSAFLRREVPEFLRRRALRTLWTSNPVLANLDGLVDHGEDYTDAAVVVPRLKTAYQVGRGMLTKVAALAESAERVLDPAPPAEPPVLAAETDEAKDQVAVNCDPVPLSLPERTGQADDRPTTPVARHMQFRFAGGAT